LCPLRCFSPSDERLVDVSWVYAMNLAAHRGLRFGIDVIWTTGPLAYLFHPVDIGNHLIHGLIAQSIVWLLLLVITADLFSFADVPVANLAAFTFCTALASPLFHFNFMGVENLLLLAILILVALLLLRPFRWLRFVFVLALVPPILLIKGTGAAIAVGVLGGLLAALAIRKDWRRALTASGLTLLLLPPLSLAAYWLSTGTWSIGSYLHGVIEISADYSILLARDGPWDEKARAIIVLSAFAGILLIAFRGREKPWILCFPFAVPLLVSLKHGFVRQDIHVINFFCLVLLLLGVFLLFMESWRFSRTFPVLLLLVIVVSIQSVQWHLGWSYLVEVSGWNNLQSLAGAIGFSRTRQDLVPQEPPPYALDHPLEGTLLRAIGHHTLGIVTPVLVYAPLNRLTLRTMPVPQGYQCNGVLDQLNARWLARQGPDKLLLEWSGVDGRHPIGENPATMLEIYKWYELEILEPQYLLLRRRSTPREAELVPQRVETLDIRKEIAIPDSPHPVFVRVTFDLTATGKAAKLLYHIPEVGISVSPAPAEEASYRVIPESLATPLLISYLPTNLQAAANLFAGQSGQNPKLAKLSFFGPGLKYYRNICKVEFMTLKATGSQTDQPQSYPQARSDIPLR